MHPSGRHRSAGGSRARPIHPRGRGTRRRLAHGRSGIANTNQGSPGRTASEAGDGDAAGLGDGCTTAGSCGRPPVSSDAPDHGDQQRDDGEPDDSRDDASSPCRSRSSGASTSTRIPAFWAADAEIAAASNGRTTPAVCAPRRSARRCSKSSRSVIAELRSEAIEQPSEARSRTRGGPSGRAGEFGGVEAGDVAQREQGPVVRIELGQGVGEIEVGGPAGGIRGAPGRARPRARRTAPRPYAGAGGAGAGAPRWPPRTPAMAEAAPGP